MNGQKAAEKRYRQSAKGKARSRRYYTSEHGKAKTRAYTKTPKGKAVAARKGRKWTKNNPAARRAHHRVRYAKLIARLTPKPCEVCGSRPTEAHHDDYSKPLEVRWLCVLHHKAEHRKEEKEAA
jgi:hypothetical protein